MGTMDQFSKAVLWRHAGDILQGILGRQVTTSVFPTEIADQPQQRTMDFVLLTNEDNTEIFYHFELQSRLDPFIISSL